MLHNFFTNLHVVVIAFYIASSLNLLGSVFNLFTIYTFKEARTSTTYLITALALSDLCSGLGSGFFWIFLIDKEDNVYCKIQAGLQMFGLIASTIWGLNIGMILVNFIRIIFTFHSIFIYLYFILFYF